MKKIQEEQIGPVTDAAVESEHRAAAGVAKILVHAQQEVPVVARVAALGKARGDKTCPLCPRTPSPLQRSTLGRKI